MVLMVVGSDGFVDSVFGMKGLSCKMSRYAVISVSERSFKGRAEYIPGLAWRREYRLAF